MGSMGLRKTRNSAIRGDFEPPYHVQLMSWSARGLTHAAYFPIGGDGFTTCCRDYRPSGSGLLGDRRPTTCLMCALCRSCPACNPGHVRNETMRKGKWTTHDKRTLYPFEMDDQHLTNTIAKLHRDKHAFKKDWREWLEVLTVEAALRGFA